MNLHVVPDDIFVDGFIREYSKYHDIENNRFVCYKKDEYHLQKIKSNIVELIKEYPTPETVLEMLKGVDNLYCHSLTEVSLDFLNLANQNITTYWIFFGFEFYRAPITQKILDNYGINFFVSASRTKKKYRFLHRRFIKYLKVLSGLKALNSIKSAVARVDVFIHWNNLDFDIIKNTFSSFKATFQFGGYTIENFSNLSINRDIHNNGRINIMLGNSSHVINNHISILERISKIDSDSCFHIYAPLSYGNMEYKNLVIKVGEKLFSERFFPIEKFIPIDEYTNLFSSINCVVMNHYRSAGAGNVFIALRAGKKVFMSPKNTQFKYFKSLGFHIYSNEDMTFEELTTPLNEDEKDNNICLILNFNNKMLKSYEKMK